MRRYSEVSVGEFNREKATALAAKIRRSPRFAQLLINRGIDTPAKFLRWNMNSVSSLYNPHTLPDVDKAVELLAAARERDELIFICGDYDADGICATTILMRGLQKLGCQVEFQLPIRLQDGYGLNKREIERAVDLGASLLVTVDCGSSNREEVAYAKEQGLKVIVTDHHHVPSEGPEADAFVNPQRPDSAYPEKSLCGAAVAWKVLAALYEHLHRDIPLDLLEFAAFATITDMMPLTGENRLIARLGLADIEAWKRPCMRALGEVANVRNRPFNAKTVSFFMGPRLNAVGRVDDPRHGAELFLCDEISRCQELALFVEECNMLRRSQQDAMVDEVKARVDVAAAKKRGFIFEYGDWASGIVGIAAGRLMNDYRLPCLMGRIDGDIIGGSGRSPAGTSLHDILSDCQDVLETFGGHASAAGFSVKRANLEVFLERFEEALQRHQRPIPPQFVDFEMRLDDIEIGFINELKELEPTGQEAPPPCFLLRGVRFADIRSIKEGRYFGGKLVQEGSRNRVKMVSFSSADDLKKYRLLYEVCDVVCSLDIDSYNGEVPSVTIDYVVAADDRQLSRLDLEEGRAPQENGYPSSAFVPVPTFPGCPAAIALPEEHRQEMLERAQSGGGNLAGLKAEISSAPAAKEELTSERVIYDRRGKNLAEIWPRIISYLQGRGVRCDESALAAIVDFDERIVPPYVRENARVLTWKEWVALGAEAEFSDVFWLEPPLDIEQVRISGVLKKTERLYLVFRDNQWEDIASKVEFWTVDRALLESAWESLYAELSAHNGEREFAKGEELCALCGLGMAQIKVLLNILVELGAIKRVAPLRLQLLGSEELDWESSALFARMARVKPAFAATRLLCESGLSVAQLWE